MVQIQVTRTLHDFLWPFPFGRTHQRFPELAESKCLMLVALPAWGPGAKNSPSGKVGKGQQPAPLLSRQEAAQICTSHYVTALSMHGGKTLAPAE